MTDQLILFSFAKDKLVCKICKAYQEGIVPARMLSELIDFGYSNKLQGNLWHLLIASEIINSENPYSLFCEMNKAPEGSLKALALRDICILKNMMELNWPSIGVPDNILNSICNFSCDYSESAEGEQSAFALRVEELAAKMDAATTDVEMLGYISDYYSNYGCGLYGNSNAFCVSADEEKAVLVSLDSKDNPSLDDLVGYESQKKLLIENTENFLSRKTSNNVLLYGDAGTGKSTSIQALLPLYSSKSLRIIEVYRHQYACLPEIIKEISKRNYRFILLLDDLSFEENETEYKYLKAVMEGGASLNPENVRIYATSNRRHLVKEDFSDRNDMQKNGDVHRSETIEEKLSLAMRFGLQIFYPAPDFAQYQNIVSKLAAKAGIENTDSISLAKSAAAWQISHGSRSGRTAKQFVASLGQDK